MGTKADGGVQHAAVPAAVTHVVARVGGVRWTVAAMLFVACTINYCDRQILGALKSTLSQGGVRNGISLAAEGYGYIIAAFQIAYGVGFLFAGRIVDRVDTHRGHLAQTSTRTIT